MRSIVLTLIVTLLAGFAAAQTEERFTINLRNADISTLAEQVSEITQRTLVLHPDLQGEITVVSATPIDAEEVWTLFQSVLRARGFIATRTGVIWQVLPEAQARANADGPGAGGGPQDIISRLIELDRLPSAEALRIIGPLVAAQGTAEATVEPNAILITDTVENTTRLAELLARLDAESADSFEVLPLQHADASAVRLAVTEVLGSRLTGTRISSDTSSNALLLRGSPEALADIRALVADMDTARPVARQARIRTEVFRLDFAEAETLAEILTATLTRDVPATNAVALDGQVILAPEAVSIQASQSLNAVVVNGTDAQIADVGRLIRELDQRRAQVMIEAAIIEVSGEAADRLSVQLGLEGLAPPGGLVATSFGASGSSLRSILTALGVEDAVAITPGLSLGISADPFGFLVQALSQSSRAKLLSTPSITTMDNESAAITVGQNVPFRTGSFATDGNTATPFTTIERRDVGIRMEVLPRVTAGDVVELDISQEVSSLVQTSLEGAADLITNTRSLNTTVLADNGSTIVLGGLISSSEQDQVSKVPGLGDAPLVGGLFRNRGQNETERTLFVFLRPTVLRSAEDARLASKRRLQTLTRAQTALSDDPPEPVQTIGLEIQGLY